MLKQTKKLKKELKNKKGVSEMVAYVLLIAIAIAITIAVFIWLKFVVPNPQEFCPDDVALIVENYVCEDGELNLVLKNQGLFNIQGFYIWGSYTDGKNPTTPLEYSGDEIVIEDPIVTGKIIFGETNEIKGLAPGDKIGHETNKIKFNIEGGEGVLYSIKIIPYINQEKNGKMTSVLCNNAIIVQDVDENICVGEAGVGGSSINNDGGEIQELVLTNYEVMRAGHDDCYEGCFHPTMITGVSPWNGFVMSFDITDPILDNANIEYVRWRGIQQAPIDNNCEGTIKRLEFFKMPDETIESASDYTTLGNDILWYDLYSSSSSSVVDPSLQDVDFDEGSYIGQGEDFGVNYGWAENTIQDSIQCWGNAGTGSGCSGYTQNGYVQLNNDAEIELGMAINNEKDWFNIGVLIDEGGCWSCSDFVNNPLCPNHDMELIVGYS